MTTAGKRLNFSDVEDQKSFDLLPAGQYVVQIADLQDREASANSKNAGARMLRWAFEVVDNDTYNGRKVWDSQLCIESAFWKIKAMMHAVGVDTDELSYDFDEKQFYVGDDELDMMECVGETIEIKVGKRPAHKDKVTGTEYPEQNRVNTFFQHEASDADLLG